MVSIDTQVGKLKLLGGQLSLDFANTVDWHDSDHPGELLASYSDLLLWSRRAAILAEDEVERLSQHAARHPGDAAAVLERAISLREAIYRAFSATAAGRQPSVGDIAIINAELSKALARLQIVAKRDGCDWGWTGEGTDLDCMLWLVARAAANLLTSEELGRVRKCAGHPCGSLFLDRSRNQSRRWCDMSDCGNRAKARRHYRRTHT